MDSSIRIIVASHKDYPMPADEMYLPVFAGAELRKPEEKPDAFTPDNSGDNISALNPYYSELTALYWGWKNLGDDYIGLAHYRRHFSFSGRRGPEFAVTQKELSPYLGKILIFTPKKRRYYIETLYSHYAHTFDASHLDKTRKIIQTACPEYLISFDKTVRRRSGYMFNMMIMRRELLDDYCKWLFDILKSLRSLIDESEMTDFEKRYPGRVSEILFNVWLNHRLSTGIIKKNEIKEIPVVCTEKTDWIKKGSAFLKAKFFGKKYDKSF